MDVQRIRIFKDRHSIMQFILILCSQNKINTKKISVIYNLENPITFRIFCKEKSFVQKPISFKTVNCGTITCRIYNYNSIKKKLINDNEYYWSMCNNSHIFFDLSNRYKKMIKSAKNKRNWWPIIKKIFY